MEKFNIYLDGFGEQIVLQVIDKESEWCEFEVYQDEQLVATFQPDQEEQIRVYLNVRNLPENVLSSISSKIEHHYILLL